MHFLEKRSIIRLNRLKALKSPGTGKGSTGSGRDLRFGYCTEFIIMLEKEYTPQTEQEFKGFLESIGDSIVVVSDEDVVKVHVHTNDPGKAISRDTHLRLQLTRIKIDNMRRGASGETDQRCGKKLQNSRSSKKKSVKMVPPEAGRIYFRFNW